MARGSFELYLSPDEFVEIIVTICTTYGLILKVEDAARGGKRLFKPAKLSFPELLNESPYMLSRDDADLDLVSALDRGDISLESPCLVEGWLNCNQVYCRVDSDEAASKFFSGVRRLFLKNAKNNLPELRRTLDGKVAKNYWITPGALELVKLGWRLADTTSPSSQIHYEVLYVDGLSKPESNYPRKIVGVPNDNRIPREL